MENPKQLVRLYAFLLFIIGLIGVITGPLVIKILLGLVVIISIGLICMKKWALYSTAVFVVVASIWFVSFIWLDIGLFETIQHPGDQDPLMVIMTSVGVLYTALYFGGLVVPVFLLFSKKDLFT